MGLIGVDAEAGAAVFFVLRVVAVKPTDLALALKSENVRRHTVKEPAVVRDHDGASGEVLEGFFQGAQRVDVEVVGGLVKQEDVRALF